MKHRLPAGAFAKFFSSLCVLCVSAVNSAFFLPQRRGERREKTFARGLTTILLGTFLSPVWGCTGLEVLPVAAIAAKGITKTAEASRPINDSEEYYVGRAVAARILSTHKLVRDPQLTFYVNEVGQAVARKSTRPKTFRGYHFAVLESGEPNAFACPGGTIFITRGLLAMCDNEDELAAVLAHEVTHVANKDGGNSISKARWTQVFTAMGAEAAKQYGGAGGNLVALFEGSIDDVFKTIVVNGYGREAEQAADAGAVIILSEAGYDPGALAAVLKKMLARDKGAAGGIFKTHPPTGERLAKVQAAKEGAPSPPENKRVERFKEATEVKAAINL